MKINKDKQGNVQMSTDDGTVQIQISCGWPFVIVVIIIVASIFLWKALAE